MKLESKLMAAIDSFADGVFYGWAYDSSKPDLAIDVRLYVGQDLIAEGVADQFRPDLVAAGFGNGAHGFAIPLIKKFPVNLELPVSVFGYSGRVKAKCTSFSFHSGGSWVVELFGVESTSLRGTISAVISDKAKVRCALLVDGVRSGEDFFVSIENGTGNFSVRIPADHYDGMPHIVSVIVESDPASMASAVEILRPIFTPWAYLGAQSGSMEDLYAGLPAMVSRRLSTFKEKVFSLLRDGKGDSDEFRSAMISIDVLNQGYEGRSEYKPIVLPSFESPLFSIVIPVHNKFELTYHCLSSIVLSNNESSFEVIVVDDCSTDETVRVAEIIKGCRVIVNNSNLGFLRSCNKAASEARGEYVVLLNNDTEVGNHWLDFLLDTFVRFERVGAVGAKLIYPNGKLQEAGGVVWNNGQPWNLGRGSNPHAPEWNYVRQVDYLSGAALAIPRIVWNEVNGLSEEYAPCYYEDTDIAFKIRSFGYKTLYCPHSEVVHFEGMSNGKETSSGLKRYQLINAPKFSAKWADAVVNNGDVGRELWKNKERGVRFRVLVIDYATPQSDKDAGSYAAIQEMRLLQANGFKVTFVPENMAHFGGYSRSLQSMGVECLYAPFWLSIEDVLRERGREFDLVYITRYDVAERHIDVVRKYSSAKILFNNADLHFLRELRAAFSRGETDLGGAIQVRDRELALMRKVDAIVTYNETEHAVIASHNLKSDNIFKCPWVLGLNKSKPCFSERKGVAFLGGFRHAPNVEAVEFMVKSVMPLLRDKIPGIEFHVYGSHVPDKIKLLGCSDVLIKGFVQDLAEVFDNCRVFVAPLISGAGIKGKVLESMARGVPSVLSPIAAEATGLTHGLSALLAERPEEWVVEIAKLYEDEELWNTVSNNSFSVACHNYSFESGEKVMRKPLEFLGFYSGNGAKYTCPVAY